MKQLMIEKKPKQAQPTGKTRRFSATLMGYITADMLWEGGQTKTNETRPVYITLAGSAAALRPFLANFHSKGTRATRVDPNRSGWSKDSDWFRCLKSANYEAIWQRGVDNHIFSLHMDLGRAEWNETPLHVEKIASNNNLPLVVVSRPQGDLVQEIEDRMERLRGTGKPFWPSSAARYCTADQKRSQADKYYRKFDLIISAEGNRAEESPKRRKDDPVSVRKQITAKPLQNLPVDEALETWIAVNRLLDAGDDTAVASQYPQFTRYSADNRPRLAITWYPIHDWKLEDVWYACGTSASDLAMRQVMYQTALELEDSGGPEFDVERIKRKALDGWPAHPAYVYGNERLSCALCILANDNDLRNGARHQPDLAAHYIHLEEVGGATFKNGRSLTDILNGG